MNRGIKGLYNLLLPVWKAKPQYVVLSLLGVLSNIPTRALNVYTLSHVVIFALEGSMKKVFILSLIYFIYMAITTIIRFWFESYKQVSEETVKETIRLNIYNKINQIDVSAYDDPEFYEVKTKILKMCDTHILDSYNKSFKLLRSIVSAVTYIGILASLSPIIIVIVLVACTIALVINFGKAKYAKSKFDELITPQRRLEYINYCFEERQFAYDIKTEIFSPFLMRGFCHYSVERKEIIRNFAKKESKGDAGAELILLLADCLSWLYLGYSIISKQILSGEFVSIINSIWGLTQQLFNVFNIIPKLYSDSLFSVVLDDFFQYNSKIVDNGKDNLEIGIKEVCFDNVTFSYKEMVPILNKVSFIARQGERIAVVGQNGAGKSTLMKVLLRLYEPDSGDIFINGRTYKSIHLDSLYREIAVVSQQVNMYSCTIAENILMRECRNSEDERIVLNALEKVGLYDRIIKLPLGINTYIYNRFDEDGVLLSGGELQKLAIARAIAKNSSILVLDEPTSSLDSLSEQQLLSFFNSECSDKILIIISHKLSLIKDFSKIIVLEDGMVVEQGIHDELMSNNGVYYKMWNT